MASEPVAPSESFAVFIPEFERLIAEVMEEWKVPGIAVAVVQNGEVTLARPYGLRDLEASYRSRVDSRCDRLAARSGRALLPLTWLERSSPRRIFCSPRRWTFPGG